MIGQTLGHYRIVEKIGAGGIGEVYRAHDEQLDRDVALKVLPPSLLSDDIVRKRFRQEALALAKLNHPNVETIFEFGTQDGVNFLAMELIPGNSLREKLREGPLSEKETIRFGMQLAQGLAAAHAHGVVHRDLKPGNLMITPDGRLKILDFGLATLLRPRGDPDMTRGITETQTVSGTLPYMSPEQLRGEPVDARSDIYAAGAVLYDMAAGQHAFPETHPTRLIDSILHDSPRPPANINPRVSPGLQAVILKSLEKEPGRRYQSAGELLVALEGVAAGLSPAAGAKAPRYAMLGGVAALSVVLLIGLALGLNVGGIRDRLSNLAHGAGGGLSVSPSPTKMRRTVAVLGFKNLSGRPDQSWLSTALSEMVTTELAAGEQLRMIPGENVARMKMDLSLTDADSYAKDTLAQIRKNLGTDYVVLGSYVVLESPSKGQLRLDLRAQDTVRGETLTTIAETGTEEDLFQLVSKAGSELRSNLGVQPVTPSEAATIRTSLPSDPEATRLYSAGLAKLRLFDALGARDNLEKALKIEPGSALAHAALARVWSALGYDERAKDEAKKGFDLSPSLAREDQLSIEAQYREAAKDWDKAIDVYRTLWEFSPDNLEYGLRLAQAQTSAGKARDALGTLEQLRKLSPPARDDARIDLAQASGFASLADFKGEQAVASKAALKGEAQGARLLVARAKSLAGSASNELGDTQAATASLNEAKEIYAAAGDKNGVAQVLNSLGTVLYYSGDLSGAKKTYEESLATYREIGAKRGMAVALNNLASVLVDQRDLIAAKRLREQSLEALRETGDQMGVAVALGNIGIVLYYQGDLAGASREMAEALAIYQKLGAKSNMVVTLNNAADLSAERGEIPQARNLYEEAAEICRKIGNQRDLAYSLLGLGGLSLDQGNLGLARWRIQEALKIREGVGEKSNVAVSRLALATVSLEEGHGVEAQSVAQEVAAQFEKEKQIDEEASAYVLLSRSLLEQQKFPEAEEAIERAKMLSAKSGTREIEFGVAITAARVRAAMGKPAEAIQTLSTTLAEATKYGFVKQQYEARLALGEIEMKSGAPAGRARLAKLQKDATAKGFLLIARKATAAAAIR